MNIDQFILKVRRHETPFYSLLYRLAKKMVLFSFPCIRSLHGSVFKLIMLKRSIWYWVSCKFFYEPVFKSQCESVGKNFRLLRSLNQALPYMGGKVFLRIGDNVRMSSKISISGNKIFDRPTLKIGNNTYIADGANIGVAKEITIGDDCLIGDAIIFDNDGHPTDHIERTRNTPIKKEEVKPITIGNHVWIIIGGSVICKGVSIGDGAIVAGGSVVVKDVEPYTLVAGSPAKVVKRLK